MERETPVINKQKPTQDGLKKKDNKYMKYKGIELKDISGTPQIIDPPREMLVWDNDVNGKERPYAPKKVTVFAIVNSDTLNGRVIGEESSSFIRCGHCAEIPTEYATFRQIARWLADGNGEVTEAVGCDGAYCKSSLYYFSAKGDVSSEGSAIRIRTWDDREWHEPTLEYMGLEG